MPRIGFHKFLPGLRIAGLVGLAIASWPAAAESDSAVLAVGFENGKQAVSEINPSDLVATVAGEPVNLLTIGEASRLHGRWQVVVYVDQELSGTRSILRFLESLASNTLGLTRLGETQLVMGGSDQSTIIRSSDSDLLEEVLFQQSLRSEGDHAIRERRLALLVLLQAESADTAAMARDALASELDILRRRRDDLVHWIAAQGRSRAPRVLFFLSEGLGVDALAFYGDFLADVPAAVLELGGPPDLDDLAGVLASYGWTFVPSLVAPRPEDDDARVGPSTNQTIGFRLRLGRNDPAPKRPAIALEELRLDDGRVDAMDRLAELTGGRVAHNLDELPGVIESLSHRLPVEVPKPSGATEPLAIELLARDPRLTVSAPHWIGGHLETVAEVRIRRSLSGDGDPGELPLRARIHLDPAELETEPAELDLLVDLADTSREHLSLRVSVGIHLQNGDLLIQHQVVDARDSTGGTFSLRRPLPLPPSTDAAIVVVEDLSGEVWGESFAEFVTRSEEIAEATSIPEIAPTRPAGPAVRLDPLPTEARSGKIRVRTQTRPDVGEVAFLLDGETVGTRRRAPFDLRIDLGRRAEQHSIIAIAYDGAGRELGRDGLVVNEAATSFWVQISEPTPSDRVGPVDVVTSYKLPADDRLERIDYYWNEELIGTTRQPPHRQRLLIPVDRPAGYIRVVATLANGKTSEDVVLMNTQRFETQITVELVELYVVVTDNSGRPVRGLDRADFIVREEQEVQNVESFAIAGDLPLTLGLAIDSSLSLFKKLPEVQVAAEHFVDGLRADRDRALLVEYGSSPRLVEPVTGDLDRITNGIRSLYPSGNTAVWEGVTLSLQQLEGSVGRRALVVFYDGDDEDENYSFKKTLDLARKSRIPIYLIVMNNEAARTQGKGFNVRSRIARLDQLARTGGGRVFYVRTDEDLGPIFEDIGEELRSHYLLTYYPQRPVQQPEWRPISVELTRSDLTARTLSGYGGG